MNPIEIIKCLSEAGVHFLVDVPSEGGCGQQLVTDPEILALLLTDPIAGRAASLGMRLDEYLAWQRDNFNVYCGGLTKKGKPCQNIVTGGHCVSAKKWVRLQGQYCETHDPR